MELCLKERGCYVCSSHHDCTPSLATQYYFRNFHLTGTVWLCRGCRVKNNIFCATKISKIDPNGTDPTEIESQEETDDNENTDTMVARNDKPSPRRDHGQEQDDDRDKNHDPTKPEICPLYKKRQCPHGASGKNEVDGNVCPLAHPRKCLKFCRFGKRKGGCSKGGSCKYYHPVLCKYSVKSNQCTNLECTYTHLKGTKRPKREDKAHSTTERDKDGRPARSLRWRKDSTMSTGSRASESYRTPSNRMRTRSESERQKPAVLHPSSSNDFLEKLMENMRKGFQEQKVEIGLMKQGLNQQIDALWKQVGSISQTSLPQLPPFLHQQQQQQQQLPQHVIPTQSQGPWNLLPNQCSMF